MLELSSAPRLRLRDFLGVSAMVVYSGSVAKESQLNLIYKFMVYSAADFGSSPYCSHTCNAGESLANAHTMGSWGGEDWPVQRKKQ